MIKFDQKVIDSYNNIIYVRVLRLKENYKTLYTAIDSLYVYYDNDDNYFLYSTPENKFKDLLTLYTYYRLTK